MYKLPVLLILVFLHGLAGSQNIYFALQLNHEREYNTKRPVTIKETNTFYNTYGKSVTKATKTFDKAGMLVLDERYSDGGNLNARMIFVNDTANRLILSRVFERWTGEGNMKSIIFYFYDDNNHLTGITTKDSNSTIIKKSLLTLNDKGQPVVLTHYDGNGKPTGKEVATYLYEQNNVITSVVSNEGELLSTDTLMINFVQRGQFVGDHETYNDKGDLVRWKTRYPDGTETLYEQDYTYDKFGNCTQSTIYKVTYKANGNKKREIDSVLKKEYTY